MTIQFVRTKNKSEEQDISVPGFEPGPRRLECLILTARLHRLEIFQIREMSSSLYSNLSFITIHIIDISKGILLECK